MSIHLVSIYQRCTLIDMNRRCTPHLYTQAMYVSFSAGTCMAGKSLEIARDSKEDVCNQLGIAALPCMEGFNLAGGAAMYTCTEFICVYAMPLINVCVYICVYHICTHVHTLGVSLRPHAQSASSKNKLAEFREQYPAEKVIEIRDKQALVVHRGVCAMYSD